MQKKKKRISAKKIIFAIVTIIVILFVILALTNKIAEKTEQKAENLTAKTEETYFFSVNISENAVKMYLPAVDNEGNGVLTLLTVEARPGKGRTLVDIDNLLFWADTQHSIRVAKKVAQEITKINLSNYDIIYNIYANASIIGGESAGAALTIATIAALQNKTLSDKVIITGTINHDGTIGPVSAIMAKAKAAKAGGANLFLVPLLQSREVVYETRKHCEKIGPAEFCSIEQVPKRINVSEEANITVIEVGSIEEAIAYFIK
ncbi:MAG: S16 family serine protease [Candidatus Pacearchaeota archaeon]